MLECGSPLLSASRAVIFALRQMLRLPTHGFGGLLLVDPGRAPAADGAEESSSTEALVDPRMYGPSQWAVRSS